MKRWLARIAVKFTFFLGVGVCVLAVRGQHSSHRASSTYFRALPDESVRGTEFHFGSDNREATLSFGWGHCEPFNGQLVRGYHVNASQSGGRPQVHFYAEPYDGLSLWRMTQLAEKAWSSPIGWSTSTRTKEADGDDSFWLSITISHWLLILLLFLPTAWRVTRWGRSRIWTATPMSTVPTGGALAPRTS